MRNTLPFLATLLLACSEAPAPNDTPAPEQPVRTAIDATTLPGYYTGRIASAEGASTETVLWLWADGTYVLQERPMGAEGLPSGHAGEWYAVAGGCELDALRGGRHMRWMMDGRGLKLDMRGSAGTDVLDKLAGEVNDDTPRMRVRGSLLVRDQSLRFQPCGTEREWPAAGGIPMSEEEGAPETAFDSGRLLAKYRDAVKGDGLPWLVEVNCIMALGPAMEGDELERYLYIVEPPVPVGGCE